MSFSSRAIVAALSSLISIHAVTAADVASSSAAAQRVIVESTNAALQGDSKRSIDGLSSVPAEQFAGADAGYRACMLNRFGRTSPPSWEPLTQDPFLEEALTTYQKYWWQALAAPKQIDALDAQLRQRVRAMLGKQGDTDDWDELEKRVTERIRAGGYYAQLGRTPPLRELMVWRKQDSKNYDVALPEGSHKVRVELLDDFVSRGWSYYARCGRGSSGGWATEDRIYAVMPWFKSDLNSDAFRASLLGHETQHFSDMTRFPKLESWELEYRAKFTELWMARETMPTLLAKFAGSQSDDKNAPHTYANKRALKVLRARLEAQNITSSQPDLSDVPPDALRAAAREQLIQDSRDRAGAKQAPSGAK